MTSLLLSPDGKTVAAGYSTGLILIFSLHTGATAVTLHGHRSAVTAGRYHSSGALLASGSADTDIVVWDTVAEAGLYRLKGHRDGVTDVVFLEGTEAVGEGRRRLRNGLASCSKDTLVKLWDLDTQSCVQTVVGHRGEVRWGFVFVDFRCWRGGRRKTWGTRAWGCFTYGNTGRHVLVDRSAYELLRCGFVPCDESLFVAVYSTR